MAENPLFTDEYIDKLKDAAERYFTSRVKILFRRKAIDIQQGQSTYKLPDNIVDLITVTYKGVKLDCGNVLSQRDKSTLAFINKNLVGVPTHFFIKESNYDTIRLWPVPSESLVANQNTIDYDYGISQQCIISYYQLATEDFHLPEFLNRRLSKYYVMKFAYQKEGESQNLKAAMYFDSKLEWAMTELESFVRDCSGSRYYYISDRPKYPRPIKARLPFNFPER